MGIEDKRQNQPDSEQVKTDVAGQPDKKAKEPKVKKPKEKKVKEKKVKEKKVKEKKVKEVKEKKVKADELFKQASVR